MKYIFYAAAALLLLASCNKNDELPQVDNYPTDGVVRIATSLTAMQTRSGGATAYTGTDLSLSTDYGTGDKYTVSNTRWTTANAGTTWTPATLMLWKNSTTPVAIYAYAPHVEGVTDLTAVPFMVKSDQSAGVTSSDLVGYVKSNFVPATDLVADGKINIALDHKLSKLTLDISFGNQLGGTATIESVTLTETLPTTNYNATTGVVSAASGTAMPITMHHLEGNKYDVILAPQTIAAGKQLITVVLSGSSVQYHYTVPTGGHTFASGTAYTMNLKVGKDKLELGNITVVEWGDGDEIPGGEAETPIEVNPNTNSIVVLKEGALKPDHITAALAGGTVLNVKGKLSGADITRLTAATTLTTINLSEVTYNGGTVPAADWSGCPNLTKIIVNHTQATAYETAWSAASDKLFYLGKELVHKVDAMTGDYAGGIPCVVIGITGNNSYRLISRNPYCGYPNSVSGVDEIYLLKGRMAACLRYNTMTSVITPWGGEVATLADMQALVPLRPTSLTIITKAENGDQNIDITVSLKDGFLVKSDGAEYVTTYLYDAVNKTFSLGFKYNTFDKDVNLVGAFMSFEVTNN